MSDPKTETDELPARAAEKLNSLLESENSRMRQIADTMIAARRLDIMALGDLSLYLQEVFPEDSEEDQDLREPVGQLLIRLVGAGAEQEFEGEKALQQLKALLPWVEEAVRRQSDWQERESRERELQKQKEDWRIPLLASEQGETLLDIPRDGSAVLTGQTQAIAAAVDRMLPTAVAGGAKIVRLREDRQYSMATGFCPEGSIREIVEERWKGFLSNTEQADELTAELRDADMLVVDNLFSVADHTDLKHMQPPDLADVLQERLKRWERRILQTDGPPRPIIACMPYSRPLRQGEMNMREYGALKAHNLLRGVYAEKLEDGDFRLHVGDLQLPPIPAGLMGLYDMAVKQRKEDSNDD